MADLISKDTWDVVWKGEFFVIEKHPKKGWERAVRPPGVRLILHDTEGRILITEEFRSSLGRKDFRLPGGKVFDELDPYLAVRDEAAALEAAVLKAARLEAKQETGVDHIDDLRIFARSDAGASVEWDLFYLIGAIAARSEQELEADEAVHGIAVHFFAPDEVRQMILDGRISEDRTAAVLSRYLASRA
jgi:8-oxo-dGTP pyrophosphatase MutT (NUDIX family)